MNGTLQNRPSTVNCREEAILKMVGRTESQSRMKLTQETENIGEHYKNGEGRCTDTIPDTLDIRDLRWENKSPKHLALKTKEA